MSQEKISQEDLVPLALLRAMGGNLQGKTRLQKLAFLLDEEKLGDRLDAYHFRKYDYGPFSKGLLEDIEDLEDKGLVDIHRSRTLGGNTRYDYEITDVGETIVSDIFSRGDASIILEDAEDIAVEYGDLPLRELIELVYEKFPEYKENSVYQY
ncbi:hypothetical protein G3A49_13355 [Haloferax volcanii]|uniref:DUF4065 domain-containing protein n=1 Tax=Haloferax volcanii TaxID=2246 RepID=A0A6C0UU59_HALVO|nr:hypothetical protein [Haloferax alexandrinus]QIB79066.1 hypothetical protein G3A49_13355 [Haloferax alexandrinus]